MTTGTSATAQDKTGETWKMDVDKDNCWEDLILTLGTCISDLRASWVQSESGAYKAMMEGLRGVSAYTSGLRA